MGERVGEHVLQTTVSWVPRSRLVLTVGPGVTLQLTAEPSPTATALPLKSSSQRSPTIHRNEQSMRRNSNLENHNIFLMLEHGHGTACILYLYL